MSSLRNNHIADSMSYAMNPRLLSPEVAVHWNGWCSSTIKLQHAGWQLSMEQNVHNNTICMALRHDEANVRGVTYLEQFYYEEYVRMGHMMQAPLALTFTIARLSREPVFIDRSRGYKMSSFSPVDATSSLCNKVPVSLAECVLFRPVNINAKQIILNECDVGEIVELALTKQKPTADQFRKQMVRDQEIARNSKVQAEIRLAI